MSLADILAPERVKLDVDVTSKKRVLECMSALLADAEAGLATRTVFDALFARERLGSTGLGHGVALPHGRVANIDRAIAAFAHTRARVDFDAPDGEPVDLVFALVVPQDCTDEHLQILAEIASRFADESLREALRTGRSAEAARDLLVGSPSHA